MGKKTLKTKRNVLNTEKYLKNETICIYYFNIY